MTRPILYGHRLSPHTNLVTTFLLAANAIDKVEVKEVDFPKGEHKQPHYLQINPAGQIPALSDDDLNMFESSAIMRYLALKFELPLYPLKDARALAPIDSIYEHIRHRVWDHCAALVFQSVFVKQIFGRDGDAERIKFCRENLEKSLDFVGNNFFKRGDFVASASLSVADVALGTLLMHARLAQFDCKHPTIQTFVTKWKAQSWYKQTSYGQIFGD